MRKYIYNPVQMLPFSDPKSAFTTQTHTPHSSHIFQTQPKPVPQSPASIHREHGPLLRESPQNQADKNITLSLIMSENVLSAVESKAARVQRGFTKKESEVWTADSSHHEGHLPKALAPSPREVIREQEDEVRELRKCVAGLRKQCLVYEHTIQKMGERIANLEQQNKQLQTHIKILQLERQNADKTNRIHELEWQQQAMCKEEENRQQIKQLKDKVNNMMELYGKLESEANQSQFEWAVWKEKWIAEKRCYVNKIEHMALIMKEITQQSTATSQTRRHNDSNSKEKRYNELHRSWHSTSNEVPKSQSHSKIRERPRH